MTAADNVPGFLTLNPGSSSLKWAWFPAADAPHAAASGQSGPVGDDAGIGALLAAHPARVVIIRFVHGGEDLVQPAEINAEILDKITALESLAPLHNHAALTCSRLVTKHAPGMRQIAVFDTEFFHVLPRVSQLYGLPRSLTEKYAIRRYGFHGFAHHGMLSAWQTLQSRGINSGERLVTIQLGSGCSMAAIRAGKAVDTTMGFTPNEGLLMSTRSGDIDPGLVTWLQRREGWDAEETDRVLNTESGWLGISGESANMKDLLNSGSAEAGLAIDLFIHRIRKTLGAYYALLGGLDGVVFSGGIAEHAPDFCQQIISGLEHLEIHTALVDHPLALTGKAGIPACRLTSPESPAACWCAHSDEHRSMLDSAYHHLPT